MHLKNLANAKANASKTTLKAIQYQIHKKPSFSGGLK